MTPFAPVRSRRTRILHVVQLGIPALSPLWWRSRRSVYVAISAFRMSRGENVRVPDILDTEYPQPL